MHYTTPHEFIIKEAIPIKSDVLGTNEIKNPVVMLNTGIVGYYIDISII